MRRELKLRGLNTQGNKVELLERLQEVLKMKAEETASATSVDELEEDLLNVSTATLPFNFSIQSCLTL